MFPREVYWQRRKQLRELVGEGLILIPGNDESAMNYGSNQYHYRQDSSFLYFFGINKPGFYLDKNHDAVELGLARNITCKYTIPVSERNKVLKKLQTMNINRCYLYGESEDNRLSDYWRMIQTNEQMLG